MCVLTMYSSGINSHSILLYICVAQVNKTNYKLSEEKKKNLWFETKSVGFLNECKMIP